MSYPSNDPSLPTSVKPGGVKLVGTLPQGFPPFTIPHVSVAELPLLVGGALGIALVSMTDTISTAPIFSARNDQEIDAHQDMVGIGAANVAAGLFQGFPVSTSGSRTAVAEQSGAKTRLVGAAAITMMLLFLPGLLRDLPQPTLAAVVIAAALSLANIKGTLRLWQQITDIDTTAADMLEDLATDLDELGVVLAVAQLKDPVRNKLDRYQLGQPLRTDHFYSTVDDAADAYRDLYGGEWHAPTAAAQRD